MTLLRPRLAPAPLLAAAVVIVAVVYGCFDPLSSWFPRCPFLSLTGLQCPGCGTQRALHALLSGHPAEALAFNPILLPVALYLLLLVGASFLGNRRLSEALASPAACYAALVAIVAWTVVRNLL